VFFPDSVRPRPVAPPARPALALPAVAAASGDPSLAPPQPVVAAEDATVMPVFMLDRVLFPGQTLEL
jgi:hypothetical protein